MSSDIEDLYRLLENLKDTSGAFLSEEKKDPFLSFIEESINQMFSDTKKSFKKPLNKEKSYPSWNWKEDTLEETIYLDDAFYKTTYKKPSSKNYRKKDTLPFSRRIQECYTTLGIAYASGIDGVKKAWKDICKKHHPDLFSDNPSMQAKGDEILKKATCAYKEIEAFLKLHKKI